MRFTIAFLNTELFTIEIVWPGKGLFPVPDFLPDDMNISEIDDFEL